MAWYDETVFYQIYPLGLLGAPENNDYRQTVHRLREMDPWISHIKELNGDAIYLGPCFQSGSHGYDTTDYKTVDCRLGDNQDLKDFVKYAHDAGLRVVFDGVFNHTGRDFFAFRDIQKNREQSKYRDWYCDLNFGGNNSYNDGFSYHSWHGVDLLPQLNQRNPEVLEYIRGVIRFWVSEFDIDGIRLDAAEDMDIDFLRGLRQTADEVKPDFWLMGEVIHGDYSKFAGPGVLHAVTNYQLHKPIYSAHNSHNYFELAYNVKRIYDLGHDDPLGIRLYNFLDNHDVSRIASLLENKAHLVPCYIILYTLPGVPSIYYGSEFGIEGRKKDGDPALRPALQLTDYADAFEKNPLTRLIRRLGEIRHSSRALSYGFYEQLLLTNRQYAFRRSLDGENVIVMLNNDDNPAQMTVDAGGTTQYIGALSGKRVSCENGQLSAEIPANSGEIWLPEGNNVPERPENESYDVTSPAQDTDVIETDEPTNPSEKRETRPESENETSAGTMESMESPSVENSGKDTHEAHEEPEKAESSKSYEDMTIEELQQAILQKMAKNGPVTPEMKKSVTDNIWHDSLVNWVKSFR